MSLWEGPFRFLLADDTEQQGFHEPHRPFSTLLFTATKKMLDAWAELGSQRSVCRQEALTLAVGIVSPPENHGRRLAQRHSWMRWPNVGQSLDATCCATFIVRAGHAPRGVASALLREAAVHDDTLLVRSIPYNESRIRGPLLTLTWWLLYAQRHLGHAQFIGKLDDDAYVHAPDLERLLRAVSEQVGGPQAHIYLGVHTWYHWLPSRFENRYHGWSRHQSYAHARARGCAHSSCKLGKCGDCAGPFAFAAGYLVLCSRTLVDSIVGAGGLVSDATRLLHLDPSALLRSDGRPAEMVMEDVWLGSIIHRWPLPSPIHYVSLVGAKGATLYVDAWDFRLSRTAVVFHVITKQLERFLAFHDHVARPGNHCSRAYRLDCAAMSRRAPEPPVSADQWCTFHSTGPSSDGRGLQQAAAITGGGGLDGGGGASARLCCGREMPNASCTAFFGSNSWPVPFRRVTKALGRFDPVPTKKIVSSDVKPSISHRLRSGLSRVY